MKTKRTLYILGGLLLAAVVYAAVYSGYLINNPVLAVDTNATLNLNTIVPGGITTLSAQAVYSSATVASATFNDGRVSTGSITVTAPTQLLSASATNQITLAATSVLLAASATNYLTVLSTTAISSAVITYGPNKVRQGYEWTTVGTTTGTAASITTAMNKYYGLTAVRTGSTIALSLTPGAAGNGKVLSVNVSSITAGGTAFGGGHDSRIANAIITANGQRLRQGYEWFATSTSSGSATALAAILNKITGIHASAGGSVVFATATVAGSTPNTYTLVSNAPAYLTVASATFGGGKDNAYVRINGITLTQGTAWTAVATASGTARAISDAITANTSLNTVIRSTWNAAGVVSATSTYVGAAYNYPMVTNYPSYITLSGVSMAGGLTPAYTVGSALITLPAHGMGTGLAVLLSTGSGVALAPLTNQTTYYAAKIDANTIALATTKANASAGTYITYTSSGVTGPHNFTLAPLVPTGSAGLAWQYSNDCTNWTAMAVSSVTFSTPYTAAQTSWNFGTVGYNCVRAVFTAPTTGAVNMAVSVSGN